MCSENEYVGGDQVQNETMSHLTYLKWGLSPVFTITPVLFRAPKPHAGGPKNPPETDKNNTETSSITTPRHNVRHFEC